MCVAASGDRTHNVDGRYLLALNLQAMLACRAALANNKCFVSCWQCQNNLSLSSFNYHSVWDPWPCTFFSPIYCSWGEDCLLSSSRGCISKPSVLQRSERFSLKTNNFTPLLQYRSLMLQSWSQEKPQGEAEETQKVGFSLLFVPFKRILAIHWCQPTLCMFFVWHNTSCPACYLTSWINQSTHLPKPQLKFLSVPARKSKLLHVPVVSESFSFL